MNSLLKNCSIREVGAPISAAANTDSNSERLDMQGYDGVCFICPITDSANTGVAKLSIEGNTIDSDTGMAAVQDAASNKAEATATDSGGDDLNDQLLIVDVYKPTKRYLQGVRTSTTGSIAFGNLIAILYKGSKCPISDDSSVLDSTFVAMA
jgi:hypothetical protein